MFKLDMFADDVDNANKATERRFVFGGCLCSVVNCNSRMQKRITLLSTESDFVATADAGENTIFMKYAYRFVIPEHDVLCMKVFEGNPGTV